MGIGEGFLKAVEFSMFFRKILGVTGWVTVIKPQLGAVNRPGTRTFLQAAGGVPLCTSEMG